MFDMRLKNLGTCDIQILHDELVINIDWFNIFFHIKIMNAAKFDYYPIQIGISRSRQLSYCKVAIFLFNFLLAEKDPYTFLNLNYWIVLATEGHLFYPDSGYYLVDENIVLILVSTFVNRRRIGKVTLSSAFFYKMSVLFISYENRDAIKVCA